jgi:hypothetical protein
VQLEAVILQYVGWFVLIIIIIMRNLVFWYTFFRFLGNFLLVGLVLRMGGGNVVFLRTGLLAII